jgi:anti-sigma B factor antagonist
MMVEIQQIVLAESTVLLTPNVSIYDATAASELKKVANGTLSKKIRNVVLDLSKVKYMDSFGLASVLSILKSCKEVGGLLVLLNPNSTVLQLIQLTKLTNILSVVETTEEALLALS